MEGMRELEGRQKIYCTVGSCTYNDEDRNVCLLESINVSPVNNCNTKQADESMCASYENEEK